ncbi:GAF domain-containing SpoIIE family protein phosphatase [Streptacidiphilus sp. PAMC 29251]
MNPPRPDRGAAAPMPEQVYDPVRLAAVRATGLLDTPAEPEFDELASLAASITGAGRAFVTFVDDRRSFWKSCIGVDADTVAQRQGPVQESFCYLLIGSGGALVIEDAANDPRTQDHPSVGPMSIGAWAGYPILSATGQILGSFCVIDEQPRRWLPSELDNLASLARAVSNEVNLRQALAAAEASAAAQTALARTLQESLLPPHLTPVPGLDTAAAYLPAAEGGADVLGDFYDLFRSQGSRWCTVLGDVCGKGVEAAKVTALARYTLRAEAGQHASPAVVLERLNAALLEQRGGERFLTAVCTTFRTTGFGLSGRLCTAGHPPALILRADGRVQPVGSPGSLIGVLPKIRLTDVRFRLGPGDALLMYTDGATEARRRPGTPGSRPMFGEDGLARVLAGCAGLSAAALIERITSALAAHTGDWPSDDTALLALRVPPRPEGSPAG